MIERIIGVLKLDAATYEAIEADENATTQAAIVVAVVAIIGGVLGGAISSVMGGNFLGTLVYTLLSAFIGWLVWSAATYFVGTSFFGGKATMGEMLRVLGFAQAPGILAIIPVCGGFVGWIWTLACTFIAIRQGLDLDNTKAFLTAIIAFVAVVIVSFVLSAILGALGLGVSVGLGALGS
jgi:hypothetical protein